MSTLDELYEKAMSDAEFIVALEDPTLLARMQRALGDRLACPPEVEGFARAERDGQHILALLMKRTYVIQNARCELAPGDDQEILMRGELPYDRDVELPFHSPPAFVNDYLVNKRETDVIVQGFAHTYAPHVGKTEVSLKFEGHERRIAVFGPRRGEIDQLGRFRFSEPAPFEVAPLRYDYAYGGLDLRAVLAAIGRAPDDREIKMEPLLRQHYPRNPCGKGYLVELTRERFAGIALPWLEHPNDPLTPERLAVGKPERWIHAPLPACWDWQSDGWFPRIGYLGYTPEIENPEVVPAEVKKGWAAADILSIPPIHEDPDTTIRAEFARAASPGLSVPELPPDATFELTGLHPLKQLYSFSMPGEVPHVELELSPGAMTRVPVHLDSVVIRPARGELVAVWSARAAVNRRYERHETDLMRRNVTWKIERRGASR